ncbi:MAG TPA: hypothetical protein VKG85_02490 [Actinomycetes bacterium]|nr:hypothetical protein [Actinomycetes bacterium]
MAVSPEAGQQIELAWAATVLVAIVVVAFWRVVLRVLVATLAVVILTLLGSGVLVFCQTIRM